MLEGRLRKAEDVWQGDGIAEGLKGHAKINGRKGRRETREKKRRICVG